MTNLSRSLGMTCLVLLISIAACSATKTSTTTADITCHADTDCPSPTICQLCNARCVYKPNAACSLEAPCPCGYSCRNQQCAADGTVQPATCTYNSDCPVDEFCNRAQFQCEYPMELGASTGVACTANSQCADGEVCSSANGANAQECAPN